MPDTLTIPAPLARPVREEHRGRADVREGRLWRMKWGDPDLANAMDKTLSYDEALDYLADRKGDEVVMGSFPAFVDAENARTALGMTARVVLGAVLTLNEKASEAIRGGSDAATVVLRTKASETEILGLTMTREWFQVATLSLDRSYLRIIVSADPDHRLAEPVGWGFAFDFGGAPPARGRWADAGGDA
jgi:hypothetical protein